MVREDKKGQTTLSKFLIAIIVVSLFSLFVFSTISVFNDSYDDLDYEDESSAFINKTNGSIETINQQMESVSNNISRLESGNIADLVGGFLGAGISTAKATVGSVNVTKSMIDASWESAKPPEVDTYETGNKTIENFKNALLVIVLIIFFITIMLYLVLGRTT